MSNLIIKKSNLDEIKEELKIKEIYDNYQPVIQPLIHNLDIKFMFDKTYNYTTIAKYINFVYYQIVHDKLYSEIEKMTYVKEILKYYKNGTENIFYDIYFEYDSRGYMIPLYFLIYEVLKEYFNLKATPLNPYKGKPLEKEIWSQNINPILDKVNTYIKNPPPIPPHAPPPVAVIGDRMGINNEGNTCFMASAVQLLLTLEPFVKLATTDKYVNYLNMKDPLTGYTHPVEERTKLKGLFDTIRAPKQATYSGINEFPLFCGIFNYNLGKQEDSQEVLTNILSKYIVQDKFTSKNDLIAEIEKKNDVFEMIKLNNQYQRLELEYIVCKKSTKGSPDLNNLNYARFSSLVSIPLKTGNTLEEFIQKYMDEEKMNSENLIGTCISKDYSESWKSFKIYPQKYLIIDLKRFKHDISLKNPLKDKKKIHNLNNFNLKVTPGSGPPVSLKYNAIASIVHYGDDMESGHYNVYYKKNGQIYHANDSNVTLSSITSFDQIQNADGPTTPYILLYQIEDDSIFNNQFKYNLMKPAIITFANSINDLNNTFWGADNIINELKETYTDNNVLKYIKKLSDSRDTNQKTIDAYNEHYLVKNINEIKTQMTTYNFNKIKSQKYILKQFKDDGTQYNKEYGNLDDFLKDAKDILNKLQLNGKDVFDDAEKATTNDLKNERTKSQDEWEKDVLKKNNEIIIKLQNALQGKFKTEIPAFKDIDNTINIQPPIDSLINILLYLL